jgi:hypothetical protein
MQLKVADSSDPIGAALDLAASVAADHTEDHPLTPELFWAQLAEHGFAFPGNPAGSDEHGRFFAHLVLDHAVATRRITGNTALHHYWSL